jgi:hypothetical protein
MNEAIFDINVQQIVRDLLPNEARDVETLKASNGLFSGFNRMHQTFLDTKRVADAWTGWVVWIASTWTLGERVIYFPTGEVFEVVVASTTTEPTTSDDWVKIQDSFIGVDELVRFNGLKLNLEFALNRRFMTTFNQPPTLSDIFISLTGAGISSFIVGGNISNSSKVFTNSSSEYVINSLIFGTPFDFTIFIPIALAGTLGVEYEKIIRTFTDKYVTFGLKYIIQTY